MILNLIHVIKIVKLDFKIVNTFIIAELILQSLDLVVFNFIGDDWEENFYFCAVNIQREGMVNGFLFFLDFFYYCFIIGISWGFCLCTELFLGFFIGLEKLLN
jgi:hypothetical protein